VTETGTRFSKWALRAGEPARRAAISEVLSERLTEDTEEEEIHGERNLFTKELEVGWAS